MRTGEKKHREIIINYDIGAASRHVLDLKNHYHEAPKRGNGADFLKNIVAELFIWSVAKAVFGIFLFLPKKTAAFLYFFSRRLIKSLKNYLELISKIIFRAKIIPVSAPSFSFNFSLPANWRKAVSGFALAALILSLPLKAFTAWSVFDERKTEIMNESFRGYEELIKRNYGAAGESFASARRAIGGFGGALKDIATAIPGVGGKVSAGLGLLTVGEYVSSAAAILDAAFKNFDSNSPLTEKIKLLEGKMNAAMPYLILAEKILDGIKNDADFLPVNLGPIAEAMREGIRGMTVFQNFAATLADLLGDSHFKRYLFIFQNNNEIRPTGGFMGSFAVLDFDRGGIREMQIPGGGTYDVKGQLKELVISPEPFHLINPAWQFQDSNWFPDFPEAAQKMMWFYEKSGGPTVDGAVAVNATLMEDFLKIIGPIEMPEYGRTITAENFIDETQKIVELEYDKAENKPKQFIADLAPKILDRLSKIKMKDLDGFSTIIERAIREKDIQVFIKDSAAEEEIGAFGLSGRLRQIDDFTDYLMIVDTNIAGQKTDGKIIKNIEHLSEIDAEGGIVDTVKITRRHSGIKGALFSGARNVNYLRVYVPEGAELISAEGFAAPPGNLFKPVADGYSPDADLRRVEGPVIVEPKSGTRINYEFGRTVFGNWIMVDPGQEAVVTLKYKLPKKFAAASPSDWKERAADAFGYRRDLAVYRLLLEKQSGARNTYFKSEVRSALGVPQAALGAGAAIKSGGWQYETVLDSDKWYGVIVEN